MIDKIEFENYRVFSSNQNLEIKPITVVFGKNNSGKTALLKLPALIESSLKGNTDEVFSATTENKVNICTELRDVIYGKATRAVKFLISDSEKSYSLDYSFFVDTTKQVQTHIENCSLSQGNKTLFSYNNTSNENTDIVFKGVIPSDEGKKNLFKNLE
ncbi:MAG: AAA family ATPase, partial [Treponema sp.]|nr:AAA family ATPase [Treponema sp.]